MPELTPRVVFDCNLFIQGIADHNSPARKANPAVFQWRHIALCERANYSRSSGRIKSCELRRKLPGINDRIVNAFLTKQ
jgi:hypothetical protein